MNHHASDKLAGLLYGIIYRRRACARRALDLRPGGTAARLRARDGLSRSARGFVSSDQEARAADALRRSGANAHGIDQVAWQIRRFRFRARLVADVEWLSPATSIKRRRDAATSQRWNAGERGCVEVGSIRRRSPYCTALGADEWRLGRDPLAGARAQTALTHSSQIASDAAELLTRIVFGAAGRRRTPREHRASGERDVRRT